MIRRLKFTLLLAALTITTAFAGGFLQEKDTAAGHFFGTSATQALGFHGATPTAQRSGAAQAAVSSTPVAAAASPTPTKTEFDALVTRVNAQTTLLNELRAALVAKGLIKGGS